jgi:hypothetical protein
MKNSSWGFFYEVKPRYQHPAPEHKLEAVKRLANLRNSKNNVILYEKRR